MLQWKTFPQHFEHFYSLLDPSSPYVTQLVGGYAGSLEISASESRPYWIYYPRGMELSSRSLTLLLPNHQSTDTFLAETGWAEVAEQHKLLLLMAGGQDAPWGGEEDGAYLAALLRELKNRKYMDTKQPVAYLTAYGESAAPAYQFLLEHTQEYAGAAFAGDIRTGARQMEAAGAVTFGNTELPYRTIPCPVLFCGAQDWENFAPVLDYWKAANQSEDRPYQQDGMEIYLPDQAVMECAIEHQPCARIQIARTLQVEHRAMTQTLWDFLGRCIRGTGINYGDMHPYRTPQQMHLTRRELQVDGYTRFWYEYVPERQHVLTDGRLPVVVFCHGGSASPFTDAINHEWALAAKSRGFVLLLPAGTMRVTADMMPHPAWNAAQLDDHMDDEKFIRLMLRDVSSRLNIDPGRIYVNGHSMGSAMAQRLALAMPELFAAAAGNSGVTKGGFMGDFDTPGVREDLPIPLWVQMGENDIGGGTLENNPWAKRAMKYWANRYHLPAFDQPDRWRDGRYLHTQWNTTQGVPMLRFTTTLEKPHCITPQDPFFYYDQFFCHYSRREDGTLCYHGKPVVL